ncbi:hypothetical protein F66182_1156 [Fusarium sp. NRRL 66182]|nr:hypothetical protein F66182_1156 [Fusarium sp. NRRL 66182]
MDTTQRHSIRFAKKPVSRKRATKACLKCRRRKVRCDVTRTSAPCTNCRLDGDECVVVRRADPYPVRPDQRSTSSLSHADHDGEANTISSAGARSPSPIHDQPQGPVPVADVSNLLEQLEQDALNSPLQNDELVGNHQESTPIPDLLFDEHAEYSQTSRHEHVPSELKALYSSTPFLKTLKLRDSDFQHLNSQGCLRVPSKPILDEFMRQYFLYIHPLLPLLNEADFWHVYDPASSDTASNGTPVSLFLLQAMMFASCTFVSSESLRVLGFSSILEAKESFYSKAKLLYDFSTDPDPISIAQAALLLTYWCPTFRSGPRKPNSRWLRIAIQHARSHFDFDAGSPLGYDDLVDELESSRVYNIATKHKLILALERLTELCVTLTDVLSLVYPTENLPVLDAKAHSTAFAQVQEHKTSLKKWAETTRPPLELKDLASNTGCFEDSAVLFTNLVWIYHHASRVALCNYELHLGLVLGLATQNPTSSSQETQFLKNNRKDLRSATKSIAECFARLHPHRLTRWLPSSAVACTALPLAMHMVDVKMSAASSAAEIWARPEVASKQSRLNVLIQVFKELHPKYDGVHSISKTIRNFMEGTCIEDPSPLQLTNDHSDVLARSPTYYLRLALTIDVCLSQDRLPQDSDFPVLIRRLLNKQQSIMPMLYNQFQSPQVPEKTLVSLPRALSPATYSRSFSRWMQDDTSVSFALEMGIEIAPQPSTFERVTARVGDAESPDETSPASTESQISRSMAVPLPDTTEDMLQRLQSAVNWANTDQSLYFAQTMGLFTDGIGYSGQFM